MEIWLYETQAARAGIAPPRYKRQASALLGALGLAEDPVVPDRLLIGIAVLTLLSDLSEASGVLVVVDDAHWLDRSSLDALAFAGHRLDSEPVVLLGVRGSAPPAGFDRAFPSCTCSRWHCCKPTCCSTSSPTRSTAAPVGRCSPRRPATRWR
jgi:hypothetical protein